MGFNHKVVGYSSAKAMVESFALGTNTQKLAMLNFLINYRGKDRQSGLNLSEAIRQANFTVVAKLYNGDTTGRYANRMASALNTIRNDMEVV